MERNQDPNVVVMDRRMYDTLVHFADIGVSEAGGCIDDVKCHVRKFNPVLGEEYRKAVEDQRTKDKEDRRASVKLLNSHGGKEVYRQLDPTLIAVVTLKGLGRDGHPFLHTVDEVNPRFSSQVHVCRLMTELPEGYRLHQIGKYKGRYVHNDRQVGD